MNEGFLDDSCKSLRCSEPRLVFAAGLALDGLPVGRFVHFECAGVQL